MSDLITKEDGSNLLDGIDIKSRLLVPKYSSSQGEDLVLPLLEGKNFVLIDSHPFSRYVIEGADYKDLKFCFDRGWKILFWNFTEMAECCAFYAAHYGTDMLNVPFGRVTRIPLDEIIEENQKTLREERENSLEGSKEPFGRVPVRTELTVISADRPWDRVINYQTMEIASHRFPNNKHFNTGSNGAVVDGNTWIFTFEGDCIAGWSNLSFTKIQVT